MSFQLRYVEMSVKIRWSRGFSRSVVGALQLGCMGWCLPPTG